MSKAAGGTLLLTGLVAVPGIVAGIPTVVAQLLLVLLRLRAVTGDVTFFAAFITDCRNDNSLVLGFQHGSVCFYGLLSGPLTSLHTALYKYRNLFTKNSQTTLRPGLKSLLVQD